MKGIATIFLVFIGLFTVDLSTVREHFQQAKDSQEATDKLYNALIDYQKDDPLMLAYKGASFTLKARFLKDRQKKKELVLEGIKILEQSVKASPQQVEIRLVRLAIQEHAPKVLKYKMNMAEDKQMILTNFAAQSPTVKKMIKRYADQSGFLTEAEREKLAHS